MNKTNISYLDYTWNPITGCSPVGPACANCWARRVAETRLRGRCGYPADEPFRVTYHRERLLEPFKAKKQARIGVCFMGDLFHEDVDVASHNAVFNVISMCSRHNFFVLTKRPDRLRGYTFWRGRSLWPTNAWLGVSVWDQESADRMIPLLLQTPAAHRWVSYEPALGPVDLSWCLPVRCCSGQDCACMGMPINPPPYLDFVVAGGETGPGARPAHPDWFRRVRDDCAAAGVMFHLKQLGGWAQNTEPVEGLNRRTGDFETLAPGEAFKRIGAKRAGRHLDGKLHDEVPE